MSRKLFYYLREVIKVLSRKWNVTVFKRIFLHRYGNFAERNFYKHEKVKK